MNPTESQYSPETKLSLHALTVSGFFCISICMTIQNYSVTRALYWIVSKLTSHGIGMFLICNTSRAVVLPYALFRSVVETNCSQCNPQKMTSKTAKHSDQKILDSVKEIPDWVIQRPSQA